MFHCSCENKSDILGGGYISWAVVNIKVKHIQSKGRQTQDISYITVVGGSF